MKNKKLKRFKYKRLVIIFIFLTLFFIPFLWLREGELELGGDSHRLFFYDPISNLKSFAIYSVVPWGTGTVSYNQYFLPYILFVFLIKSIFVSSTIVINIFNGIKLAFGFVFIFLIIKEFLQRKSVEEMTLGEWSGSIVASFFYVLSPAILNNMKYALVTHDQVFLNPLFFYLLLKYVQENKFKYLWVILVVSFIFSSNFAIYNPPIYAFYPIILSFLFFYTKLVLKKKFPMKGLLVSGIIFVFLHLFHVIPLLSTLFSKGTELNSRTFESISGTNIGLSYFDSIVQFSKVSASILLVPEFYLPALSLFIAPFIIIFGLIFSKKNNLYILLCIFFLMTLFLVSANITRLGREFYRVFFLIPGFGMFRNFSGQWQWVYTFFYSLLFGLSIIKILSALKKKYMISLILIIFILILLRSIPILDSSVIRVSQRGSKGLSSIIVMDAHYKKLLKYIYELPSDGKMLHVPFTDFAYNLVGGSNNGVYVGQSMTSLLVGRNDFAGYQHMDPYSQVFKILVEKKNFSLMKRMLELLQVRYILLNQDNNISDKYFPEFPYGYTNVPASSKSISFVEKIAEKKIFSSGDYHLYELDNSDYLPHFYPASNILTYDANKKYSKPYYGALSFFPLENGEKTENIRSVYIENSICKSLTIKNICGKKGKRGKHMIKIFYKKINPTKYKLSILGVKEPVIIVFQEAYNSHWKIFEDKPKAYLIDKNNIYLNGIVNEEKPANQFVDDKPFETFGMKSIFDDSHFMVNGYSNAWYIDGKKENYNLIIEMMGQQTFYITFMVSILTLLCLFLYGLLLFKNE